MNSVSVITRAYDAEAPYIKSFIDHYFSIGCSEIHICISSGNPSSILENTILGIKSVFVHKEQNIGHPIRGIQNIALPFINTTHIIAVDVDEFLDIFDISVLLESDYIRINWLIAPSVEHSSNDCSKLIKGFYDGQCKFIVRTDLCKFLNEHNCVLKINKKITFSPHPLIHYTSRSFKDLFLKCSMSRFQYYQASNPSEIAAGINNYKNLPVKFKIAAVYLKLAQVGNENYSRYFAIDYDIENDLVLQQPYSAQLHDLKSSFECYYSQIDLKRLASVILKNKYYISKGRIPHYHLAGIADRTLVTNIKPSEWCIGDKVSLKNITKYLRLWCK